MKDQSHDRQTLDRRSFVKASLVPAALAIPESPAMRPARGAESPPAEPAAGPEIIDSNVHLFQWPFRRLKYDRTEALVRKLRRHRIAQAWAGSFESVLHKQLDGANRRLADECRERGGGLLIPIGSVNPIWPDWDEDLRRCHEQYQMRGIRLYPAYHGYALDHPEVLRLLASAARRGLLVQIVIRMEDERVHHPSVIAPRGERVAAIRDSGQGTGSQGAATQRRHRLPQRRVRALIEQTRTMFDIAALEGDGGIGRLIDGTHPTYRGTFPWTGWWLVRMPPFFPCESALLKLFESPLDRQQLDKIMFANARTLLGTIPG